MDVCSTATSVAQRSLENRIKAFFKRSSDIDSLPCLERPQHIEYLHGGLRNLPGGFASLEAARPWILYWITHSLALLKAPLPKDVSSADIADFLRSCQSTEGGVGGGLGQPPHLAPTYAAIAAAVTCGEEALAAIDRQALQRFLERCCVPPEAGGGFQVCSGGEVDVRGCYTAIASAHIMRLDTHRLAERAGMVEYIRQCQTYEGGLGGEPGNEAHGGYTFCGLAALALIGQAHVLNLRSLLYFAASCQGAIEGGFMGRTNKLVDGCYSFWQGGLFPLLQRLAPDLLAQEGLPKLPGPPACDSAPGASQKHSSSAEQEIPHRLAETCNFHKPLVVPSRPYGASMTPHQQATLATERAQAHLEEKLERLKGLEGAGPPTDASATGSARLQMAQGAVEEAVSAQQIAAELEDLLQDCALTRSLESSESHVGVEESGSRMPQRQEQPAPLYDVAALQTWLLLCCQAPGGGMRDKPGKPPDYYHTCYCLSGLSSAQHFGGLRTMSGVTYILAKADPLCNVEEGRLAAAMSKLDTFR